tara:strand:+ start:509 stop:1828 length:1320 start_codon:yes stop_codon:yes gene_type:complete
MPLYKFGPGDVFYNQLRTYPSSSFYIYSGSVFYQNKSTEPGSNVTNVNGVPVGNVSLFELNVDRASTSTGRIIGLSSSVGTQNVIDNGTIYPFVEKGLQKVAFKGLTRSQFINDYADGDIITGSYMMSSSITRRLYGNDAAFNSSNKDGAALRNSLNFAKRLGPHYDFPSASVSSTTYRTNAANVIYIPSIFYGSEIKKGTVDLKVYVTGTLVGRARDTRYDGALIQSDALGSYASGNGDIVGVVLYKEGVIILTGSADEGATANELAGIDVQYNEYDNRTNTEIDADSSDLSWLHFGLGLPQGGSALSLEHNPNQAAIQSASFGLDFAGTHKIPTVTMLANANRGELNYTNNPTYIEYGQIAYNPVTSSTFFGEQALNIKNIHSASYTDPTGSLKKTTYITKIGIYDENKKLIGVASMAKPVKKTEERDLTFKLKLDI